MNTKYCANCGSPNYFSLTPPNLCSNCGSKFGSIAIKTTVARSTKSKIEPVEEDDLAGGEDFSDVDLVDVKGAARNRGIKMQDWAFNKGERQELNRNNKKLSKKEQQEMLKSFIDGAKNTGKAIDIAGGNEE